MGRVARTATVALLALLSGCATLSEQQCRQGDWHGLGAEDGSQGRYEWYLRRHVRSCQRYGIELDAERYWAGRTEGLQRFCTPENGYQWGLDGKDFVRVCPPELAPAFERAYDRGRAEYAYQQHLRDMEEWMKRGVIEELFQRQRRR